MKLALQLSHYECMSKNKTANHNLRPKAADGEFSEGIRPIIVSAEQGRGPNGVDMLSVQVCPLVQPNTKQN